MKKSDITYTKNNQKGSVKGMVYYTNYVLSEENTKYVRQAYTYMDVIGDTGGLIEIIFIVFGFFLIPINYNISGIKMLKQYVLNGQHQKMSDLTISLKSFFFDLLSNLGL